MIALFGLASALAASTFNDALATGDLDGADAAIRGTLDAGAYTSDVYYNLGNLRYRQDRLPEAVLAWRCAAALAPRDPDVRANLDVARRKLPDHYDAEPVTPAWAPWQRALTPAEGEWVGAALAGAALLGLGLGLGGGLGGARARVPSALALGVGAWVYAGAFAAGAELPVGVLQAPATATSDLGGGSALFTLSAGAEVQLVDQGGGQLLVALPDGRRGWTGAAGVALADPLTGCVLPADQPTP